MLKWQPTQAPYTSRCEHFRNSCTCRSRQKVQRSGPGHMNSLQTLTQVAVIAASCCVGPGRWWWLSLNVVAASLTDLHWCLSWPLHLLFWPLHLELVVLSFYQPAQVLHLHTWWWYCLPLGLRWWRFSFSHWRKQPCTGGGVTRCNLRWWSFSFHPLAHILCLRSSNLNCVVLVCGGGIYIIIFRLVV